MSRIRLNQEYRNKGGHRFRDTLWNKNILKKKKSFFNVERTLKLSKIKLGNVSKSMC